MSDSPLNISRRAMLGGSLAFLAASSARRACGAAIGVPILPSLLRDPDMVRAELEGPRTLASLRRAGERWSAGGVEVGFTVTAGRAHVTLAAPEQRVRRVHLRWRGSVPTDAMVLGDAWERSYGELAWLPLQADHALPWYFLCSSAGRTAGMGVKTGAGALAFWQVDAEGVSLWLDVRNGGSGVRLGERTLLMASVVQWEGRSGESAWQAAVALCREMAKGTAVPRRRGSYSLDVIYGSNDWYYAYGRNTAEGILRDADLMRELAPASGPLPYCIVDDGYQDRQRFPSMQRLSEDIRSRHVVPGVWIRPTRADAGTPAKLLVPAKRKGTTHNDAVFDPTIPEARERILACVRQACDWGYDFIKHDFTTWELLGQWGFSMGASPTGDGWQFYDPGQTNAEILRALYADIRRTAGEDRVILGCNTIGHLAVGLFDAQRTGDDVSGREWERTRRMGVNTLAFRLPQHRVFFATDADCVPLTPDIPWPETEQWLQAVAGSGSVCLVSPDPRAITPESRAAMKRAFALCAQKPSCEPVDWQISRTPSVWRSDGKERRYAWLPETGASPFSV